MDLINSVVTENILINYWNSDCLNSFLYFLTNVTDQTMSRGNSYLDKVRTVSIQESNLQKFIAKLANHLSGMTNLSVLNLSDCSLTASNMKHIASSLVNKANLTDLNLTRNGDLGGSAISWSPHLKQMKHLQKLHLSYCSLTGEDMTHIAVSLSDMLTLVELDLSGNTALGGSAISRPPHLKQMKHLQKLHLSYCSLTGEDMKHIAVSLSDMPTLVELNLSGNTALGGSAISWSPHLKQMKHLQKLDLSYSNVERKDLVLSVGHMSNLVCCLVGTGRYLVQQTSAGIKLDLSGCSLTGTDLVGILEAISNRSDLVELILSKNDGLGGSAASWSPHLKKIKYLQNLHLSLGSVTDEDIKHIAVSLSDMPSLAELNLSGNEALGGSAISWSPHLKQMKHLQKLDLSYCSLRDEDMKHIAVSLSDMPTLVELNLSSNEDLVGGSAISWSPHLKQMKHLQKLQLSYCSLRDEDMKHIAVSLSDMPTLVELNLSGNTALGGSAISWSPHLKQMKHLQKLDLSYSNVQIKDLKYLVLSVGHMSNLVCCLVGTGRYLVQQTSAGIKLNLRGWSLTGTDLVGILEAISNRSDLVELILNGNDGLGGSAISWSPHLMQMKHLQKLQLSWCSLTDEDMKHIAVSLSVMPSLAELDLSGNTALGGSAISSSPHLKQMKHLQKLHLSWCSLTDEDMKHIAVLLSDMPSLAELNLLGNEALGGSAISWSPHLKQMKHLQNLHLSWCSLTDEDMKHIAVLLSDMPSLAELNLSGNEALCGSAISWSPHLKQMKHLQNLHFSYCSLTDEDMKHIAVSLSDMPTLAELDLSGNTALGGSAISWSPHLKQMKHLQKLHLSWCSLTDEDMKHIAVSLSDMPTLAELDLSGNTALGGSAISWSPHLKQMKHLQKLHLSWCSLTDEDMKHIAVLLSDMPSLAELNLSGNEALGGSAISWSPHLKQMKHLQKLHLSDCSLTDEDMKHIAVSLSDMPTLAELDLSGNEALGGSAISWSPRLKQMKNLQKLDLTDCSLTHKDMKHIAASLSDMPTLLVETVSVME